VQLQRLVVEDVGAPARRGAPTGPLPAAAVDFDRSLTVVALRDEPARRPFVGDLLAALGRGRPGLHLELIDGIGRSLVVFRPIGGRALVVDTDSGEDLTDRFTTPDGGAVDVLAGCGLDPAVLTNILLTGGDGGDRRRSAMREPDQQPVDRAEPWVGDAQRRVEEAARAHQSVLRLGAAVGGACLVIGSLLLVFDDVIDDNRWTAKALFVLAALAFVLAIADRQKLVRARREAGRAATAVPSSGTGRPLPPPPALLPSAAADADRLVHHVAVLRALSPRGEPLPLVLDEPAGGADRATAVGLLGAVARVAAQGQQVVVVTSDRLTQQWASGLAAEGRATLVVVSALPADRAACSTAGGSPLDSDPTRRDARPTGTPAAAGPAGGGPDGAGLTVAGPLGSTLSSRGVR
jgi:hypothetical protein